MKRRVQCIACTRDEGLRQQLLGWLGERHLLTHASDVDAAGLLVQRHSACVLLLDLRVPRSLEFLEWLSSLNSICAILCFAEERSRPALMAEERGVTELLPFVVDRKCLQAAVARGAEIAELRADNKLLQSRSLAPAGLPVVPKGAPEEDAVFEINRASLCLDDPELLLSHAVQTVSTLLDCGRVTLYLTSASGEEFVPSAGRGVRLDSMTAVGVSSELASWLKLNSQIMASSSLHRVEGREERLAISAMLSALQADAIAPLSQGNQLIGWIAVGAPLLGGHLEIAQLSQLMRLCASLSAPIARSQEYRRVGFKRRLLEMVFENLPTGVIALDSQEQVLWMNQSALTSLGTTFKMAIGQRLGDLCAGLYEATKKLAAAEIGEGQVFRTAAGTPFLVQAQPISPSPEVPQQSLGLLLTLHDASAMEQLREQREAAFRRDILAEMSVAMAFKIRAPLATIKTFIQLLPERRDDPDFLDRYRRHIANDVNRLEELSHSMHEFSLLQSLPTSGNTKTQFSVSQLIDLVRCLTGEDWDSVQLSVSEDLPLIEGNCARLAEGVCHLLSNAREANKVDPFQRIQLRIARESITKNLSAVAISITDHRPVQKVGAFVDNSNLTSEEAQQRANLRLTFTAEIVQEFSGDLSLSTTEQGATVKVLLLA